MKAKIFEIKRFAVHDGDGIRTTVFFKGCPLKCVWCHNPEGIAYKPELALLYNKCTLCGDCVTACPNGAHKIENGVHTLDRTLCVACGICENTCLNGALKLYGKEMTVDELMPILLEDKDFYESSGGGVTLSGGECLMQADFCADLLRRLKENGIHTAVDTCGFVSKATLDKVLPYADVFLYDVKAVSEDVHINCTGVSNKIILENLRYLDSLGKKIEIRIPYVPTYNDSEIQKIAELLATMKNVIKIRVLPYHNYAGSKYASLDMVNTLPATLPSDSEIQIARNLVRSVTGIAVAD